MRFSSDNQPANRGRKPGSLNKVNRLIRDAAPELATAIMEAMLRGADPQSAESALQALHTAAKVHELYGFEQRITALERSSEGS